MLCRAEAKLSKEYSAAKQCVDLLGQDILHGRSLGYQVYAVHSHLHRLMSGGAAQATDELLSCLSIRDSFGAASPVQVIPFPESSDSSLLNRCLRETLKAEHEATYGSAFDLTVPTIAEQERAKAVVSHAFRQLSSSDPSSAAEIVSLCPCVAIMHSQVVTAGSSFMTFGLIYMRAELATAHWRSFLEDLLHECAHHVLFAIWSESSPVDRDGDRLFSSPLRPEPRPLSALFHQMFVLARLVRARRQLETHFGPHPTSDTSYRAGPLVARSYPDLFREAWTVVDGAREFLTPFGEQLLDSCNELAN
jgi:HEXXH motif-containing protein